MALQTGCTKVKYYYNHQNYLLDLTDKKKKKCKNNKVSDILYMLILKFATASPVKEMKIDNDCVCS